MTEPNRFGRFSSVNRPMIDAEMKAVMDEALADVHAGRIGPQPFDAWWERRRPNEQTPDYLGRVLEAAGLPEMARDARAAHYDDFQAPAEVADGMETLRLVRDLRRAAKAHPENAERIAAIDKAVRSGEFDATKAESDRWAASESGQSALRELVAPKVPKVGRNEPCPCQSGRKYKLCHGANR